MLQAQSAQVDTVSGATLTSRAVIQAANDALGKAR
ncbi:MAG: FMN-binding protein [Spirochaetaceae bacterium]|nr:FMN-binding protein [Spirochaetaceae bacterium]